MSAISSLSSFLQNIGLVQNAQNQIAKLTYQVDTGLKSEDLEGYGTQVNQLLNLQSGQTTEQNYVSNNTQTSTFLTAYDSTLGQLSSDAGKLLAALGSFSTTDPSNVTTLKTLVNGLQVDLTATLNSQVGGRYLYGGTRYTTQPVDDLTAASQQITAPVPDPNGTPPTTSFTPVASPQVPIYDTQAAAINPVPPATSTAAQQQQGAQTYQTQNTTIANGEQMTYGISSNDASIQTLISSLQNALGATQTGLTPAQQQQFIQNASSQVQSAMTGLQTLQGNNGTAETLVANANAVHTQTIATLQSQVTAIAQVDPATVATELSSAQTQLEGSYKVVSSVLNETLLNYLK